MKFGLRSIMEREMAISKRSRRDDGLEIKRKFVSWVESLSPADSTRVALRVGRRSYTASQLRDEVERETPFGATLLEHILHARDC